MKYKRKKLLDMNGDNNVGSIISNLELLPGDRVRILNGEKPLRNCVVDILSNKYDLIVQVHNSHNIELREEIFKIDKSKSNKFRLIKWGI